MGRVSGCPLTFHAPGGEQRASLVEGNGSHRVRVPRQLVGRERTAGVLVGVLTYLHASRGMVGSGRESWWGFLERCARSKHGGR